MVTMSMLIARLVVGVAGLVMGLDTPVPPPIAPPLPPPPAGGPPPRPPPPPP